jgi:hypothetical protein
MDSSRHVVKRISEPSFLGLNGWGLMVGSCHVTKRIFTLLLCQMDPSFLGLNGSGLMDGGARHVTKCIF